MQRRSFLKSLAGAGAASAGALVAGRTSLAAPWPTSPSALSRRQQGGTLNVAIAGDIRSLEPYGSNLNVWSLVRFQVYDTLFWVDHASSELIPNLGTEWSFEDPTTFAITVRDDVTFHSGAPFTAEDVKFTLDYVIHPDNPTGEFKTRLQNVAAVEVVDPTHLRILLKVADASIPSVLSGFYILSREDTDVTTGQPNGTGPFTFVEWKQNDSITVERNPNYWVSGRPSLERVVLKVIPEAETRIASLQSGQVDFISDLALQDVPRLEDQSDTIVALSPPANNFWHIYLNMRQPPFDNVKVRQAVLHAFDRESYVSEFAAGHGKVTNTPLFDGHWAYNADVVGLYPYDLERAAQLLAEAGYPGGQGLEFEFIYPPGYPDFRNGSILIQAAMAELGAQVEVSELELATWSSKIVTEYDFDAAFDLGGGGTADPAAVYGASVFLTPSETNFLGLTEEMIPEYTALIKEGAATTDQTARVPIYHQLQQIWAENVPDLIVAHRAVAYAMASRVQGFEAPSHGRVRLDTVTIG
ncbi:MAG: ABC transporter substrate-binding protein [Thermomicrobiales bacterium]